MNDRYIKTSNLSHKNDLYEKTLNSLYLRIYKKKNYNDHTDSDTEHGIHS